MLSDYTALVFKHTNAGCTLIVDGREEYHVSGGGHDRTGAAFAKFLNMDASDQIQELKNAVGVEQISYVGDDGRLVLRENAEFDRLIMAVEALGYYVRPVWYTGKSIDGKVFSMVHFSVLEQEVKDVKEAVLNLHTEGPEWAVMEKLRREA